MALLLKKNISPLAVDLNILEAQKKYIRNFQRALKEADNINAKAQSMILFLDKQSMFRALSIIEDDEILRKAENQYNTFSLR